MSNEDKIKEFEEELRKTKYNKRTQHHIGLVKAKIAKLKEDIETKKKGKGKTTGYVIKRSGDATVVMVGFPSVGKSTLLNKLTDAESKVAAYEFTTLDVIPGMLEYNNAKIQIFDVPGILKGAADGTGRGKEVLAAVRSADLVLIMLDINQMHHLKIIERELYDTGIRLNQSKPDVKITKTSKGGINIGSTVPLNIEEKTIKAILNEFKIINADVLIRSPVTEDQIIDVIETNKKYMPGLKVINKIDTASTESLEKIKKEHKDAVFISADHEQNLEELKQRIFDKLEMIRIFLKQPGKEADMEVPMIIRNDSTLRNLCDKLHKDFVKKFRFARVWGSARYDGQKITSLNYSLKDKDVVELHIS